jgi:glycosyltransferase involved in cell wall biosynthesis
MRYGLPAGRRWILYVGSEQPRKNFVGLIRAFAELHRTRPDLALLKVGQPEVLEQRERARSAAHALGVADAIYFIGHASQNLRELYNLADLFVFPSLYEGFGLPPLEAMACGTPVICSNRTSLPEVVGEAALICEPDPVAMASAMARVLDDPGLARDLARRGRRHAEMQSWARVAEVTRETYLAAHYRALEGRRTCAG